MQPHGPWTIVRSRTVHRDPWIDVRLDDVIRPDGQPGTHSLVSIMAGVCVLALDDDDQVQLTDEFHYAVGRAALELVSGGIEPDEDPRDAARRELREELGIDAEEWTDFGLTDPFTSTVLSPTRLFLARRLTFGEASPEGTERIRRVSVPFDQAIAMAMDGRIAHAPSALLVLKAARRLGR